MNVLSALGEPLRAEIEIPEISADEAASLRTSVASPDAFRAAGVDYNQNLSSLKISLQKRPDGRSYLRLSGDRPINDPFIDIILEANWSAGRILRDYTLLFDPSNMRPAAVVPLAPASPVMPSAAAPKTTPAESAANSPSRNEAVPARRPVPVARAQTAAPNPAAIKGTARPAIHAASGNTASGAKQVTVKTGDTAGAIAARNKPEGISLDQMLLGLLNANPDAFIDGNVNRLKAGAVLDLPDAAQAGVQSDTQARTTIQAQSRDFNEFRRKLASAAPTAQVAGPTRQSTGKVQANVEDRKAAAPAPDKLTLSKGAVQGKPTPEDKIAKERQSQETSQRVAELSKNIADLKKLGAPAGTASAAPPALSVPVASAPPVAAPASAAAAAPAASQAPSALAPAVSPAASSASAAATPAQAASSPVGTASAVVAKASKPAASPLPMAEPSLVDELMENPIVIPGAVGLIGLLGFAAWWRARQRKKNTQVDSSFLESRLQPDSFFGASGGQRIDTNEGAVTGSSMVYSPSQLDAAGDVDPVAEADVYLAYGRDLQAEEILKEAMRINPTRVAIHAKLLEIYAKRRDAKAFEVVATEAHNLTKGEGPEWAHICDLGRELDPSLALYQPGGAPGSAPAALVGSAAVSGFAASTVPQSVQPELAPASDSVDFDLDLDFSSGDEAAPPPADPVLSAAHASGMHAAPSNPPDLAHGLDFPAATVTIPSTASRAQDTLKMATPDLALAGNAMHFELPSSAAPATAPAAAATHATPAAHDAGMIEFDLGSLSLDLDAPVAAAAATVSLVPAAAALPAQQADPLETKLSLAQEFHSIGDRDGARALAEEVLTHASGALKSKAQKFLAELA